MMMGLLVKNEEAINTTLWKNNRNDLSLSNKDFDDCKAICKFLKDFQEIGVPLGKEDDVTISRVMPVWDYLRSLLKVKHDDNHIVRQMKPVMLAKLNNRYSDEQTKFFKMCTLLDVRYKNSKDLYGEISNYIEAYTDHVKHICEEHNKI